jgi:hypothetical protein
MLKRIIAYAATAYFALAPLHAQAKHHTVNSRVTTLAKVAEYVGIPIDAVRSCNPLMSARKGQKVKRGERVFIGRDYKVISGDTYDDVRLRHGVKQDTFDAYNKHVKEKDNLQPRDILYLPCDAEEKKNYRTITFPSGLELRIIEKDSELGNRLIGDVRCENYKWRKKADRKKLQERCQFYNPREGELLLIRKQDLGRRISEHFKLRELVRANFPTLIPSRYLIQQGGESFFKYAYIDVELIEKLEELRVKTKDQIPLERKSWTSVANGDVLSCDPNAVVEHRKTKKGRKVLQHCRKHGFRPYVYNIRMYKEIDGTTPITKSAHVSGKGADLALNYCNIKQAVEEVFKEHGLGRGEYVTHVDILRRRRWNYNGLRPENCKKHTKKRKIKSKMAAKKGG